MEEASPPSSDPSSITSEPVQKKRKRNGRASRRRKAKLRDIQAAEDRLFNSGESTNAALDETTTRCIPTDRDKIWQGVLEKRGNDGLSLTDEASIIGQLGYLPGNAISVAARSHQLPLLLVDDNVPIVLKLYPLAIRDLHAGGKAGGRKFKSRRRGKKNASSGASSDDAANKQDTSDNKEEPPLLEPFPTLYWLTHPVLRTLTSKLELTDHVRSMEDRLQREPGALESMKRAHTFYGQERYETLTKNDLSLVQERKWQSALDSKRGVAGIRKHFRIKCLHTHLAHYLSGGRGSEDNVVGKWVMESISRTLQEKSARVGNGTDGANNVDDKSLDKQHDDER